jgi:hypothetical protein
MKIDPELSLNEGVQHRTFLHPVREEPEPTFSVLLLKLKDHK